MARFIELIDTSDRIININVEHVVSFRHNNLKQTEVILTTGETVHIKTDFTIAKAMLWGVKP